MTIIVILLIVALAGAVLYFWSLHKLDEKDEMEGVILALRAVGVGIAPRFTATQLIVGYQDAAIRHPLTGLTARVEDSGTVNRRLTATRMLLLGPLALAAPKKLDDRTAYLIIEGPGVAIMYGVNMRRSVSAGDDVRRFAMEMNLAVSMLEDAS
jgi:hypothetical protein